MIQLPVPNQYAAVLCEYWLAVRFLKVAEGGRGDAELSRPGLPPDELAPIAIANALIVRYGLRNLSRNPILFWVLQRVC